MSTFNKQIISMQLKNIPYKVISPKRTFLRIRKRYRETSHVKQEDKKGSTRNTRVIQTIHFIHNTWTFHIMGSPKFHIQKHTVHKIVAILLPIARCSVIS